jgi:antitoxin component of MazEF toxin-antitoxin module
VPVIFRVLLGKTGNSLRVTLPRPIVEGFQWKEGDEIVLYVSEGKITLEKGRDAAELKKEPKVRGRRT